MSFNFNSFNSHPNSGFNSSRTTPNLGYNFQNDGQGFDFNNSNFGQNHVINYGQNGLVSHRSNQPALGFGQLSLCRRVNDAIRRNNFSTPQRVHIQSVIDYFPVQNQPGLSEMTVTEVVKTTFLTSNSTKDGFLTPNDQMISSSQQHIFPNRNLFTSDQPIQIPNESHESIFDSTNFLQNWSQHQSFNVPNPLTTQNEQTFHNTFQNFTQNQPTSPGATMSTLVNNSFTESMPLQNVRNQNPRQNQPNKPNFTTLGVHSMAKSEEEILDPQPLSVFVSKTLQDLDQNQNPADDQDLVADYISTPRKASEENSDADDHEGEDDGRTHSLSRKKYGPYTCPKCKQEFLTSQSFAAHVVSAHYKYETAAERKKRLDAKYKKRNLRVAQSSNGLLTIVPDRSFKNIADWRKKAPGVAVKIERNDQVQKQGEDGFAGTALKKEAILDEYS